jgi:hypothetical protein
VPCLRCGSDIPVDAIEVVYDRDVARTVALMRGQFDNVRCISGCPTDIPSSAVFYAKEEGLVRGIAVYTANLHDRFETAVAPELRRLAPRNGMGVRVDTMDELRQDVAELLTARIRPCLDLLTARSAPDFGKRWRELTVARFTALKVALEGALPRVQLAPGFQLPAVAGFGPVERRLPSLLSRPNQNWAPGISAMIMMRKPARTSTSCQPELP